LPQPREILENTVVINAPPELERAILKVIRPEVIIQALYNCVDSYNMIIIFPSFHSSSLDVILSLVHETVAMMYNGSDLTYEQIHYTGVTAEQTVQQLLARFGLMDQVSSRFLREEAPVGIIKTEESNSLDAADVWSDFNSIGLGLGAPDEMRKLKGLSDQ